MPETPTHRHHGWTDGRTDPAEPVTETGAADSSVSRRSVDGAPNVFPVALHRTGRSSPKERGNLAPAAPTERTRASDCILIARRTAATIRSDTIAGLQKIHIPLIHNIASPLLLRRRIQFRASFDQVSLCEHEMPQSLDRFPGRFGPDEIDHYLIKIKWLLCQTPLPCSLLLLNI